MPDLIRHPEVIEFTGFRLSPEWRFQKIFDFLRNHQDMDYEQFTVTTQVQGFPVQRFKGSKLEIDQQWTLITWLEYIFPREFKDVYEPVRPRLKAEPMAGRQARQTRTAIHGFINYLKGYEEKRKTTNRELWTLNQTTWVVTIHVLFPLQL